MRGDRILTFFGATFLMVCFAFSVVRIASLKEEESNPEETVLKIAHTNLEPGVREALQAVIERYQTMRSNIVIKELAVPERIYRIWMETKLFGGNAPDIVLLARDAQDSKDLLGHFLPIDRYVEQPNPYNADTDFSTVPWKDTFLDRLCCSHSYNNNLLATYGVPVSVLTTRVYFNRDLLQRITGSREKPESFSEFIQICRQVERHRRRTGEGIFTIVGSAENALFLFRTLFGSQTQRLTYRMEPTNELNGLQADAAGALISGWWNLRQPEIASGLQLIKEVADSMTPGFLQLKRDDALFRFIQGQAVMIVAKSTEAESIRIQAQFDVGIFRVPLPTTDDPLYGRYMLGPQSEANFGAQPAFGIYNRSSAMESALDFLQYLTSKEGNALFSRKSGWLPSVSGIAPTEYTKPFIPQFEGYRIGFNLEQLGSDTGALFKTSFHRLIGEKGSVEDLLHAMEVDIDRKIRIDLTRTTEDVLRQAAYFDSMIGALWEVNAWRDGALDRRISEILESQTYQEEVSSYRTQVLEISQL